MARTMKLPARANALTYTDTEVADVMIALLNAEDGVGVVVDDNTDTEPKARVRCRNMAALVAKGVTVTVDELDDITDLSDEERSEVIENYGVAEDDKSDATAVILPGFKVRTHVIEDDGTYVPALSRKPS